MESYLLILGITGLLNLVAFIWLLIVGFKRSILWGILIFLFSPLSALIFAITNWYDAKKPFLAYLVTTIALVASSYMFVADYSKDLQDIKQAVESGEIDPNEAAQYIGRTDELPGRLEQAEVEGKQDTADAEPGAETLPNELSAEDNASPEAKVDGSDAEPVPAEQASAEEIEPEAVVEENKPSPYPSLDQVKPDPLVSKRKAEVRNTTRVGVNKLKNYLGRYFEVTKKDGTKHRGILIKVTESTVILERKIYKGTFTYKIRKSQIKRIDMFKKEYVEEIS